jgi:hypothetical protein
MDTTTFVFCFLSNNLTTVAIISHLIFGLAKTISIMIVDFPRIAEKGAKFGALKDIQLLLSRISYTEIARSSIDLDQTDQTVRPERTVFVK